MKEGKPAWKSLGMIANGSGVLVSAAGLAVIAGAAPVVLPVAAGLTCALNLVAHTLGWFGRKRAKETIQRYL